MLGRPWSWHDTLLLKTAAPTAALALLAVLARALLRCEGDTKAGHFVGALAHTLLSFSGTLTFLLYPSITSSLFAAFNPRAFDGGNGTSASFLAVDLSIPYHPAGETGLLATAETHRYYQVYALLMILVAAGVPLHTGYMCGATAAACARSPAPSARNRAEQSELKPLSGPRKTRGSRHTRGSLDRKRRSALGESDGRLRRRWRNCATVGGSRGCVTTGWASSLRPRRVSAEDALVGVGILVAPGSSSSPSAS